MEAVSRSEILAGMGPLASPEEVAEGRSEAMPQDQSVCPAPGTATTASATPEESPRAAHGGHAVTRDRQDWNQTKPTALSYLRHAQQQSGRRPLELALEFMRLQRGPGKITWPEYVQYGVYDTTRHDPIEQSCFISNTLHWPITHACCDMTWQATTEDKWLCAHILARSGVRTPQTMAVIDRSDRVYPGTEKISTPAQLRDFMTSRAPLPVFAKENRGICSFGAFLVLNADREAMFLKGHGPLGYAACMDEFVGETPYLLQTVERNHSFLERYTEGLATVRVCVLLDQSDVKIPFAVLKLPARGSVADSFWRPGNLACAVDPRNGEILTARSKNALGTTDHERHPESGEALVGEVVPMWQRILDLARACAPIFAPVRYQSMDVAITEEGPVLIEVNTGGGFDLPQLATGEGFLTDEVRTFFRACGYTKV